MNHYILVQKTNASPQTIETVFCFIVSTICKKWQEYRVQVLQVKKRLNRRYSGIAKINSLVLKI